MDHDSSQLIKIFSDENLNPRISLFNMTTYKDGDTFLDHTHQGAVELMSVISGFLYLQVNNQYVKVKKNECLIIFPGIVHNLILKKNEKCKAACLVFSPGNLNGLSKDAKSGDFSFLSEVKANTHSYTKILANNQVSDVLQRIYENHTGERFSNDLQKLYFYELYIHLSEELNEKLKKNMHSTNSYLAKSLDYINNNYTNQISVEDVAKNTGLSLRHLSRLFMSEFSMSIHEYITFLRIEKSKTLLKHESCSIASISADLGFSSSQHFATTFKKHENISPRTFRKDM